MTAGGVRLGFRFFYVLNELARVIVLISDRGVGEILGGVVTGVMPGGVGFLGHRGWWKTWF